MKDEIDDLIMDKLNSLEQTLDDFYNGEAIRESIENQTNMQNYNKQRNDYKIELLRMLDSFTAQGVHVEYSSDMSIDELEKIINKIKI